MRILVNYSKIDKPHLSSLAYMLRGAGVTAVSTIKDLTIGELLGYAKAASCSAILCSNEQTLRYLVPGEAPTVDKWRGTRLNLSIPTIIINKIEHISTVSYGKWLLEKDLAKLKSIRIPAKVFGYTLLDDTAKFGYAQAELSKAIAIAYDIETRTIKHKGPKDDAPMADWEAPVEVGATIITCASWTGIYLDGSLRTYVLPLVDFGVSHWANDKDYVLALKLMKRINSLPQAKCMHNGMYDATHSIRYHCPPMNYCLDTMALAHAQYSELPKTLDFVASYELYDYIYWKDDAESAAKSKDIEKYWAYNAKDTWHTARILVNQLRNSPAYALKNYASKFRTVYPALYCNFEGIKIDQEVRIKQRTASVIQLNKARDSLRVKFANDDFNPGSWQQVEKYIYRVFGAKKPNIGKSKSCTDEKNLKSVAEQHPLLARLTTDILSYREAQKAIGTYYDFLQCNSRLLYALNPFGTVEERMACTSSSLWCGTQVQNIPPYAKSMLVADDGYELFEADNKQSEGRTTAYLAQETDLIKALEDADRDFYKTLGTLFFNIPYEKVTKAFRNDVLKRIVHGTNYMMGAQTFIYNVGVVILFKTAGELGITILEKPTKGKDNQMTLRQFAQMLLDSYHKPFPKIKEFYKEVKNEIATTGFSVSPLGHTRRFFGDINTNHSIIRSAVAHKSANLSVSILDRGFNRIYHELVVPGNGDIRLKAQIHDSVFGQIKKDTREYYAPRILHCMDNPIIVHGRTLSIPVDIKFGINWAEQSEDNPNGTIEWVTDKMKGA